MNRKIIKKNNYVNRHYVIEQHYVLLTITYPKFELSKKHIF